MTCLASPLVKKTPLACHLRDNNACLFFLRRFRQVVMTANSDSSYLFSLLFLYFSFVLLFGVLSHAFSPYRIAPRTLKRSWENNVASKDSFWILLAVRLARVNHPWNERRWEYSNSISSRLSLLL